MIAFTVLSELPPRAAYRLRERLLLEWDVQFLDFPPPGHQFLILRLVL